MLKTKNKIKAGEVQMPLFEFHDDRKAVTVSSSLVDLIKKREDKVVAKPINYGVLEKNDKGSSHHPLLRIRSNRNEIDGAEDALQFKSPTDPFLNNKKRRYSSKRSSKDFVLSQDLLTNKERTLKRLMI